MVRETGIFIDNLVREDRGFLELLDADYTFMNERLARHYGIPWMSGDEFRLVRYPAYARRGVMGHGSVLLLTSMSDRTSPVLRGKWVMEVLMGTPPPPPPPNIPAFDLTDSVADGRRLTTRERMERHRSDPTCNSCHRFMDPIGLALDNFDVTGKWRVRENMMPLDTRGTYYDGTPVSKLSELTEVLLARPIPLVRNFAANLLAYAMGRRVEYYDQPAIRTIVRDAESNEYRMSTFILGVVRSDPFQMRRSQPTTESDTDGGMEGDAFHQGQERFSQNVRDRGGCDVCMSVFGRDGRVWALVEGPPGGAGQHWTGLHRRVDGVRRRQRLGRRSAPLRSRQVGPRLRVCGDEPAGASGGVPGVPDDRQQHGLPHGGAVPGGGDRW